MILLTKEECFDIVADLPTTYIEDLGLVAKAQVKKVVEHEDCWWDTVCAKRVLCIPESLLKEGE